MFDTRSFPFLDWVTNGEVKSSLNVQETCPNQPVLQLRATVLLILNLIATLSSFLNTSSCDLTVIHHYCSTHSSTVTSKACRSM